MKEAHLWFHSANQQSKTRILNSICSHKPACEAQIHTMERETKKGGTYI